MISAFEGAFQNAKGTSAEEARRERNDDNSQFAVGIDTAINQ